MSRIAIVGGHGKIARLLIPQLVDAGHQPVVAALIVTALDTPSTIGKQWEVVGGSTTRSQQR